MHLLYELLHYKGDVDALDMTGRSPLVWALQDGDDTCIRLLLAAGADPFVMKNNFLGNDKISGRVEVMIETAMKLHVVRKLVSHKYNNKMYGQVFPFKDAFGIDEFEKELTMSGYRFKGKSD